MKTNKDFDIIYYINKHYNEIIGEVNYLKTYEKFVEDRVYQKAIILDLIQIGENVNKLSETIKSQINKIDLRGVINFRNQLVHNYESNNTLIVWNVIKDNLSNLVDDINRYALINYYESLKKLLNKEVEVIIDRKINSVHPSHKDIIYELNYGYIKDIIAPDNEYQDAYVLGVKEPIDTFIGIVIAIIHRVNDNEDKLVIASKGSNYTEDEIIEKTKFQEKFFEIKIIK